MKNNILLLILLIPSLIFSRTVQIERIIDGDTFVTTQKEKIRLLWVDAPEKKQDYGLISTHYVKKILKNKKVKLSNQKKDIYNRTLASIDIGGIDLAENLLLEGLAWVYLPPSSELWKREKQKLREKLQVLEQEAKKKKLGLWQGRNPIAPWIFRKKT